MSAILAFGQAGAAAAAGSPAVTIVGILLALALEALLLKLVAGSILGFPVRYPGAFLATIVATVLQYLISVVVVAFGALGPAETLTVEAAEQAFARDPLMPFGLATFLLGVLTLAFALTVAIRLFIRGPDREQPSWFNASLSAIAVTILLTVLQYGMARGLARA